MRDGTEHTNRIFELLFPQKCFHRVHFTVPGPNQQKPYPGKCRPKTPYGFSQKIKRKFLAETDIAEEDTLMAAVKVLHRRRQRRGIELHITGGEMRNRFYAVLRNAGGKQYILHCWTVAIDAMGNSK